jgi:hypothetical protein
VNHPSLLSGASDHTGPSYLLKQDFPTGLHDMTLIYEVEQRSENGDL